ncbi:MAG: DUF1178 family protein [Pseudomonadota bacterium]
MLKCAREHRFESWFKSAGAYDALAKDGLLSCPECGSQTISKALMSPVVSTDAVTPKVQDEPAKAATDQNAQSQAIAELRKKVEENADYVGDRFAEEARAIHDGRVPERAIYGEAKPVEAKALIEDGVPLAPLPFIPSRKAN